MNVQTVLFTPADRPDRVRKAWRQAAADVVVADLEDAVAPDGKQAAREHVARLLEEVPAAACARAVRINAWPGPGETDIARLAPLRPDLIVVPKAEDPDALHRLGTMIAREQGDFGGTRLMLILESPLGVLRAQQLCAVPGVAAVAFGAEDLAAEAGMRRTAGNAEVAVPRAMVAMAAAAHGVAAVDMVTVDYKDVQRTRQEAREARDMGYRGKMCLHPGQVEAVRAAFAPTPEEQDWAQRVLAAVEEAGAADGGVIVLEGRMVDRPLVLQARRIMADAQRLQGAKTV